MKVKRSENVLMNACKSATNEKQKSEIYDDHSVCACDEESVLFGAIPSCRQYDNHDVMKHRAKLYTTMCSKCKNI